VKALAVLSRRIDLHSFTWAAVKHKAEVEIAQAQETLEKRNLTERDGDFLRGRIALAREILELPEQDSEHASE